MKILSALLLLTLLGLTTVATASDTRFQLGVDGLACPFCAYGIEKQLSRIEGVNEVDVDVGRGQVTLTMDQDAALTEERAAQAVERAGFTLKSFKRLTDEADRE